MSGSLLTFLRNKKRANKAASKKTRYHYYNTVVSESKSEVKIVEEKELSFWWNYSTKTLHVLHRSGKEKRIKNKAKIQRFLDAYQTTQYQCRMVRMGTDKLGLFKRKWFF